MNLHFFIDHNTIRKLKMRTLYHLYTECMHHYASFSVVTFSESPLEIPYDDTIYPTLGVVFGLRMSGKLVMPNFTVA